MLEPGGMPTAAHRLRRKEEIPPRNAGKAGNWPPAHTPGILTLAITSGTLTVEDADGAKAVLEQHRFIMSFRSFRDVLPR